MAKLVGKINHNHILLMFAALFFLVHSHISLSTAPKFVSPDEVTNYFFINLYSQTGQLSYSDDLNETAGGIIRPRLTSYIDGKVVPEKFLGFAVISGTVGVISPAAVRFITPLLAVLGALFLYLLLRDIFDRRVALLSFFLLLISAPYWYWSSLVMFENVAGSAMLIISLRYFFKLLNTGEPRHYLLAGLFFGLSVFIRPEYALLGIPLLVLLLWNISKIRKAYAGLAFLSLPAALGPLLIFNNELYGGFLLTGQHVRWGHDISRAIPIIVTPLLFFLGLLGFVYLLKKRGRWRYIAFAIMGLLVLAVYFLRPGFIRLNNLFDNSLNLIALTPLLFSLGLLGFIYCLKKRMHWQYMAFAVMCLLVLALYFLSGRVLATGVHSSYVRYLLPVYMLFLPFISYLILSLKPRFVALLLIVAILATGIQIVHPEIESNIRNCNAYARLSAAIVRATEQDAVIFLEYWDKAVFPDRSVGLIRDLPSSDRSRRLAAILMSLSERDVPVYVLIETYFKRLVDHAALSEELSASGYLLSDTGVGNLYAVTTDPVLRVTHFDREDTHSEVGELRDGALFSTGLPGLLLAGPSVPMKAGQYTFVLTGAARSTAGARVEVVSHDGGTIHGTFTLASATQDETGVLAWGLVSFAGRVTDREVRVYVEADDEVRLDGYEFIPVFRMSDFDRWDTFSQVGEFRDRSIVSTGREGFLLFGPYVPMDAGEYMLVMTGAASSTASAWADVVSSQGSLLHGKFPLTPTAEGGTGMLASRLISLDEEVADLEVRLHVGAEDEVRLDCYELIRVYGTMDTGLRVIHFARWDIHSQVGELRDGSLVSTGREGFLVFGPYVPMPAGEYSLVITGSARSTASALVDVVSGEGSVRHAEFTLTPASEGDIGVLASGLVYLDEDVADLEVRVWVGSHDDVRLSGYELVPIGGVSIPPPDE